VTGWIQSQGEGLKKVDIKGEWYPTRRRSHQYLPAGQAQEAWNKATLPDNKTTKEEHTLAAFEEVLKD
jgi:hypothetical protein